MFRGQYLDLDDFPGRIFGGPQVKLLAHRSCNRRAGAQQREMAKRWRIRSVTMAAAGPPRPSTAAEPDISTFPQVTGRLPLEGRGS
jgi:hypothetical protein